MRTLAKGENASLSCKINEEAKTVTTTHTVKEDKETDVRTELTWTFDFSKCTVAQLLTLAERSIRIRKQADWRRAKDKKDATKWHNVTFDVAAELEESRKTVDPVTKAERALAALSPEQREAILAALAEKAE